MSNPRHITVAIAQSELLGYLTGERSLALPADAKLVSLRGEQRDPDQPQTWFVRLESESFEPVAYRIPTHSAESLMRKPVASLTIQPKRKAS